MTKEMKCGYGHGMQPGGAPAPADFLAFAEKVERAGFDSFWLDDHLAFRGAYLESLAALAAAAAAARTARVTLGSLVYLLPLRRPAVAAKAAAAVDYLSGGGRFVLGIGIGGEAPEEFDLCGVPRAERGARTDEAVEVLRKLWSGEAVSHRGRFFRFREARQSPPPPSAGGPPIWVGGRSAAARRRAALLGDGWVPYLFSPARYRRGLEEIRRLAAGEGRAPDDSGRPWTPALHLFFNLRADERRALSEGAENLSARYGMDMGEAARKYLLRGSVERCAETLRAFGEAGARHVIFKAASPAEAEEAQMRRLAEELLPEVRRNAG